MASPTPVTGSSSSTPSPNPNMRMRAVVTRAAGRPNVLEVQERDKPILQADEVLIKVAATCTNKIDLMERRKQANVILGHECSGHIVDVGANVTDWQINEPVCALLRGGGYAEFAAVPSNLVFRIPQNVSVELAASLPFLTCSTYQAILECEKLREGTTLLILDGFGFGFGEFGIFAMRVAKALYNTQVFVVSDNMETLTRYKLSHADHCINSAVHDFREQVDLLTDKRGVDVILNYGGVDLIRCQQCMALWGYMMVAFDVQEKRSLYLSIYELRDFSNLIMVCDLRQFVSSWSQEDLSEVVKEVKELVWPLFEEGRLECEPRMIMPLSDAATAHKRMEYGMDEKIILTMEEEKPPHEWKLTSLFTNMWTKFGSLLGERAPAGEQTNSTKNKRKRE